MSAAADFLRPRQKDSPIACVVISQLNDSTEDTYRPEIVVLGGGKELRILKHNPEPGVFDLGQLTNLTRVIGFEILDGLEILDGRAYAVVNRAIPLPAAGSSE